MEVRFPFALVAWGLYYSKHWDTFIQMGEPMDRAAMLGITNVNEREVREK
jgi:hypothetical protein